MHWHGGQCLRRLVPNYAVVFRKTIYLPLITKTIKIRWTRHAGHCLRSRGELISDVFSWTSTHGRANAGWPAWTYIQQLCVDTGCSLEDLSEAMDNREGWLETVSDIRADGATWWWWWYNQNGYDQVFFAKLSMNEYSPNNFLYDVNFILNQRYRNFIILSGTLFNQNWYY